jgi:hypothetical protein
VLRVVSLNSRFLLHPQSFTKCPNLRDPIPRKPTLTFSAPHIRKWPDEWGLTAQLGSCPCMQTPNLAIHCAEKRWLSSLSFLRTIECWYKCMQTTNRTTLSVSLRPKTPSPLRNNLGISFVCCGLIGRLHTSVATYSDPCHRFE